MKLISSFILGYFFMFIIKSIEPGNWQELLNTALLVMAIRSSMDWRDWK